MGSGWIQRSAAEIWGLPSGQTHFTINFYMALHGAVVEIDVLYSHTSLHALVCCLCISGYSCNATQSVSFFPLILLEAILKYVLPDKIKWNLWISNPKFYCGLHWEKWSRLQTPRKLFECSVRNTTRERDILASLERARDQLRPFSLALRSRVKIIHGNFIFD